MNGFNKRKKKAKQEKKNCVQKDEWKKIIQGRK
jgi:hypothetical protein